MRTTKSRRRVIVEKITTYKCDFCNYSTTTNKGCCGVAPIMTCDVCDKDMCNKHRDFITEDAYMDYPPGIWVCPDCYGIAHEAWEWADLHASRHDDIYEITRNRIKEILDENQKHNTT